MSNRFVGPLSHRNRAGEVMRPGMLPAMCQLPDVYADGTQVHDDYTLLWCARCGRWWWLVPANDNIGLPASDVPRWVLAPPEVVEQARAFLDDYRRMQW